MELISVIQFFHIFIAVNRFGCLKWVCWPREGDVSNRQVMVRLCMYFCLFFCMLSSVQLFATPWTVAHQAPLSMGSLPARILEWIAMPSSRGSSQPRDRTQVSHIAGGFFTV